jgi:tetratricopeptide (TPR) repeat protein
MMSKKCYLSIFIAREVKTMKQNQQIGHHVGFITIGIILLFFIILILSCSGQDKDKAAKLNNQGVLYLRQGDYVNAEKMFKEALKYYPESYEAHSNLSKMYNKLSNEPGDFYSRKAVDHAMSALHIAAKEYDSAKEAAKKAKGRDEKQY